MTKSALPAFELREDEVSISAIRAQGAGGQNVNKVSSAIHLRFDIAASSLPADIKERLLAAADQRITKDGVLVLKAQQHRTQEMNKLDAYARLHSIIEAAAAVPLPRKPTKPSYGARQRRMEGKARRSETKALRRPDRSSSFN
ncbi:MAG: alternative ribosome rescue aminoacyl-tRNA hydrolase ArfB [Rhodoferax sp.]|nr:alternative ribosome rescue aminoacyl-tRNA hydrolase ArfB [Rhodoferax sp.]